MIQLYKAYLNEVGLGAGPDNMDRKGKRVRRMVLEYCEGGDFLDFTYRECLRTTAEEPVEEWKIW
jgi:hypothetical protein